MPNPRRRREAVNMPVRFGAQEMPSDEEAAAKRRYPFREAFVELLAEFKSLRDRWVHIHDDPEQMTARALEQDRKRWNRIIARCERQIR